MDFTKLTAEQVFKKISQEWATGFGDIPIWTQCDLSRRGKIRPFKINKTLKQDDWVLLDEAIRKYNIHSVLEFGTGLSTYLFALKDCVVVTFDTNEEYVKLVRAWIEKHVYPGTITYHIWENKVMVDIGTVFDLCVVDGAIPRDPQLDTALHYGKYVFIHDTPQFKNGGPKLKSLNLIEKTKRGRFFENPFTYTKKPKIAYW